MVINVFILVKHINIRLVQILIVQKIYHVLEFKLMDLIIQV